jgi:single-strand DNA-binding protein
MYNKVILVGNLTRDVEVRYTPSGTAIGNTGLAVNRKFKAATGEQKEETMFVDITFFGRTAEIANQYLRKGSKVLVDGRLKLDQWTAQDGSKRSKHSVTVENLQMLGSRDENAAMGSNTYGGEQQPRAAQPSYDAPAQQSQGGYSQPAPSAPQSAPEPSQSIPEIDISEDEIPF